jgi:hypothetical protein
MTTSTHSTSSQGSAQYHVHAHTPSSSEDDDDAEDEVEEQEISPPVRCRNPSLHESWYVTPPPCFTLGGNSPQRLENNPMENLLIEHPSMSVYEHRGGRPNSRGTDAESSGESDTDMDTVSTQPSRSALSRQQTGRSVRLAAGLSAAVAMKAKKSAQVAHKRKEARKVSRAQLDRTNKVQKFNSMGKVPRRKQQMCRLNSGRNNDRKCHY